MTQSQTPSPGSLYVKIVRKCLLRLCVPFKLLMTLFLVNYRILLPVLYYSLLVQGSVLLGKIHFYV